MFAQFIVTLFFVLAAVYARLGEEAAAADKKFNVESDGRTFLLQNFYWSNTVCTNKAGNTMAYPMNFCRYNYGAASGSQYFMETCDGTVNSNHELTVLVTYYQDSSCTQPTHTATKTFSTYCAKAPNGIDGMTYSYSKTFPTWTNGHYSADFASNDYYCSTAQPWQYNYTANNLCQTLSTSYSSQFQYCSGSGVIKANYNAANCANDAFVNTNTYAANQCKLQDGTYKVNYCV